MIDFIGSDVFLASYLAGFVVSLFVADRMVNVVGLTKNSPQDYTLVLLLAAVWPLLLIWLIFLGIGAIPQLIYSAVTCSIKFTLFLIGKVKKD